MTPLTEVVVEQRLREAVSMRKALSPGMRYPAPAKSERKCAQRPEQEHTIRNVAEAISWLDWLDGNDAALVQARAEGARWKLVCWRFGVSRATAHRRWRRSLRLIAKRLQEVGLQLHSPVSR